MCMEAVARFAQPPKRSQVLAFVACYVSCWETLSRRTHHTCLAASVYVATCRNVALDMEMLLHASEPGICARQAPCSATVCIMRYIACVAVTNEGHSASGSSWHGTTPEQEVAFDGPARIPTYWVSIVCCWCDATLHSSASSSASLAHKKQINTSSGRFALGMITCNMVPDATDAGGGLCAPTYMQQTLT